MATSLAKKLAEIKPYSTGLPCGIRIILDKLEGEDKEALEIVLNARTAPNKISHRQIHEFLVSEGFSLAYASVRLHRARQCKCFIGVSAQLKASR